MLNEWFSFMNRTCNAHNSSRIQARTMANTNAQCLPDERRAKQNGVIQPLLTDLYQITMAYAYWKSGKTRDIAVFDLYFRKNPFQGEFTIFAGLEECLTFLENFHYSDSDIKYLRTTLPESIEEEFFSYLRVLTAQDVILTAIEEGTVVFPRIPLLRVEGPLIIVQLLETTLLTLVNFASLMATNAARFRIAAGSNITLLEFGLRRAQGPDGGLSASKYAYLDMPTGSGGQGSLAMTAGCEKGLLQLITCENIQALVGLGFDLPFKKISSSMNDLSEVYP